MADETATKMYVSAREKLKELLRQEIEIKEQISHWGPIVEQLARLSGETIDSEKTIFCRRFTQMSADQENQQQLAIGN
jgi:hypothetical protein